MRAIPLKADFPPCLQHLMCHSEEPPRGDEESPCPTGNLLC